MPEGWECEAVKWQPDDETETIVCLYPPGVEHLGYSLSLYLWNISLYNAMPHGNSRATNEFEDGMTVDEWIAAREAARVEQQLEEIPEYKVEKVADDIRRVSNAEGEDLSYDTVAYLRVVDGQGMWMVESYPRENFSEEHEALKEQIMRSVEILP